jgi:1-acyl-sn-glycerol-3-phosphate acyltransferase
MTHNNKHPAGILRSLWIMLLTILYTANTCIRAILRGVTHTSSRQWVDLTLSLWVQRMLRLLRISCQVVNPLGIEPVPGQVTLIMCNHSSLFDIPISLCAFPKHPIRMLAKKEMARIPLMKHAMIASEFPFIDRHNRRQAIRDLEDVQALLKSGIVMWIAPEGTRSHDGHVGPFKKGAFITAIQANAVIIPIGIRGAFDVLPARTWRFNLHQHVEVHIGEPIDASLFTLENKEALIHEVREAICQLANDG